MLSPLYIYTHTHTYVHTRIHTHTYMHTRAYTHTHVYAILEPQFKGNHRDIFQIYPGVGICYDMSHCHGCQDMQAIQDALP